MRLPSKLGRAEKQAQTRMRIVRCAQRLCLDRGFEGFTMEELAGEADVSRRTLFNYFPSKVDAVLGSDGPDLADPLLEQPIETFCAGGPHGSLVEDLGALADHFLASKEFDRDIVRGRKEALLSTPKLVSIVHERFETVAAELTAMIARRMPDLGATEARLVVHLLVAVFDTATAVYADEHDDRQLADHFRDHLRLAADLLHR